MRRFIYTMVILLFCESIYSQNQVGTIKGVVADENNFPIAFALVNLQGTEFATTTDELGTFLLKADAGEYILHAQFIGYTNYDTTITIVANQTISINLKLISNVELLNSVEVNGMKTKSATATRTLMELQDVPQSIQVVGQRLINQQGAFDMASIAKNLTGLNFTGNYSGAGSYQFFNARGFDLVNSQNYRWNGVMVWNLGNNYGDNIEQIEFLKGPTSILYGDVSPGGILNFVTKKPLSQFYFNAEIKTEIGRAHV